MSHLVAGDYGSTDVKACVHVPIRGVRSAAREGISTHTPGSQPCVFLDRDGVLNSTDGYVNSPDDLDRQLLPRSLEALARLSRQSRVPIVLVTNQGGIDEGHMTDGQARAILERLTLRVQEAGGRLDAVYYCPIRA